MNELLRLAGFALTASIIILAALLLSVLLRHRASARSAYIAWLIVLLAVLIPIRPRMAPSIRVDAARVPAVERRLQAEERQQAQAASLQRTRAADLTDTLPAVSGAVSGAIPQAAPRRVSLTPVQIIGIVYALGAFTTLLVAVWRHMRYMRLVRRWRRRVLDPATLSVYDECVQRVGLRRRPVLYQCGAVSSPMAIGVLRPCVLLPDTRLNLPELRLVLCHELTHCRRGDLWIKLLQLAARCLHWYNPLIYAMNREINYACEASCDEQVMRGADLDTRQYYSETIIAVIRRQGCPRTALSTTFYGGKKGMKNRILSIMDMKARRRGALILCPVLVLALAFSVAFATESDPNVPAVNAQDLSSLFAAEGDPLDNNTEAVAQKALEVLDQWRPARRKAVEIRFTCSIAPVQYGNQQFDTLIMDICEVTDAQSGEKNLWRVYLTPVDGTPLLLRHVDSVTMKESAMSYYCHPLIQENTEVQSLVSRLPRRAVVNNPLAAAANITHLTTDYDYPQGCYFNGTELEVLELRLEDNNVPMLTDAATIYWARVRVAQDNDGGTEGWMPLCTMTFSDEIIGEVAALPVVQVTANTPTGHATLYAACDGRTVVTSVASGTQVELLGCFAAYDHVRLPGGETGFLPRENVTAAPEVQALIESVLPERLDDIQPGKELSYEEYEAAIQALWDEYGDSNEWPLEVKARASQLRLDSGWQTDLDVNILPGKDDMPEAEALALAERYIEEQYKTPPEDYVRYTKSFYYKPEDPQTHIWWFRFTARVGGYDCGVGFDQQGNVVRTYRSDDANKSSFTEDALEELLQTLGYYAEYGISLGAVAEPQASALMDEAWSLFNKRYPEAGERSSYRITAEEMRDGTGEVSADLRWQLVRIRPLAEEEAYSGRLDFEMAVVGDQKYSTTAAEYRDRVLGVKQERRLRELEAQLGPFYTWSVEDKAKYGQETGIATHDDISTYKVPTEEDISQQQAYDIALRQLQEVIGVEAAQEYRAFFTFESWDRKSQWRIDFYTPEVMESESLNGYIVFIDGRTGQVTDLWTPGGNG